MTIVLYIVSGIVVVVGTLLFFAGLGYGISVADSQAE